MIKCARYERLCVIITFLHNPYYSTRGHSFFLLLPFRLPHAGWIADQILRLLARVLHKVLNRKGAEKLEFRNFDILENLKSFWFTNGWVDFNREALGSLGSRETTVAPPRRIRSLPLPLDSCSVPYASARGDKDGGFGKITKLRFGNVFPFLTCFRSRRNQFCKRRGSVAIARGGRV